MAPEKIIRPAAFTMGMRIQVTNEVAELLNTVAPLFPCDYSIFAKRRDGKRFILVYYNEVSELFEFGRVVGFLQGRKAKK